MAPACALPSSKTVCVMDASGRLGNALVESLLQRGYTVHAALCNHDDVEASKEGVLGEENKMLKVFRADPFDYHSIVDALRGCSGLFYSFETPKDQPIYDDCMVEMEVRTAHNVLEACAQTETMERVVFTSSVTAVVWKEGRKSMDDLDERDWSEPNFCRKLKLWHALAKTLAEKTAWALAMDRGVDMVSINSGLLTGREIPVTTPYLKGAPEMYEDGVLVTVDIKFLVDAHIYVFESPSAYGRYLCFNHAVCRPEDVVKFSQMLSAYAACPPPSEGLRVRQQKIKGKKLNKAMLEYAEGV
ncbi:cinnamoyl-CoA reductase-like SNL6 [Asparagus officinalis]|uniref:cinnamoyl-CoA reductase-like SNL6 n=1 Tax=Asparagus officinalis TaxID=4686 RepID=UPI00098E2AA3|nr:cinnamoyl-CoA reductase-like SNL6 [Asparagus officinalis]